MGSLQPARAGFRATVALGAAIAVTGALRMRALADDASSRIRSSTRRKARIAALRRGHAQLPGAEPHDAGAARRRVLDTITAMRGPQDACRNEVIALAERKPVRC